MAAYIGSTAIPALYLGSTRVTKIYSGSTVLVEEIYITSQNNDPLTTQAGSLFLTQSSTPLSM
jgi:hypothetical protein